jgi:hypothetical protein
MKHCGKASRFADIDQHPFHGSAPFDDIAANSAASRKSASVSTNIFSRKVQKIMIVYGKNPFQDDHDGIGNAEIAFTPGVSYKAVFSVPWTA